MQIRMATAEDAAACARIYAPVVRDTAISFELDPPIPGEMARRITDTAARFPWLVSESGDEVVGYAYAAPHRRRAAYRWSVEVSAYVAEDARRQGVARRLYGVLFGLLCLQGFRTAFAGITLPNPASVALHEGLGFTPVGVYRGTGYKLDAWHDVGWWQRPLTPIAGPVGPANPPPEPRAVADLDPAQVEELLGREP